MGSLDLDNNASAYQIRSYTPGKVKINELIFNKSIIVTPDTLIENWAPQTITELSKESLEVILSLKPDILLLGTGSQLVFVPLNVYGHLINQGIGVELMDTSAACRTFNALTAENRDVVAALIIR